MRKIEKLNEMEGRLDKDKIFESIIQPLKINKSREDNEKFKVQLHQEENNRKPILEKYWKERTNQPYKIIMKNEKISKEIKKSDDLIVHTVTQKDKEGVAEDFDVMKKKLGVHDGELKAIYSTSKENEHKKNFDYVHVYKYRVQENPSESKDHSKLKNDQVKRYKDQQRKEEDGKKKKDMIFESLISEGIFDQSELDSIKIADSNQKNAENEKADEKSNDSSNSSDETGNVQKNSNEIDKKKELYAMRQKKK